MSTEEEIEETIKNINTIDFTKFYPNFPIRSSYITQVLIYQLLWKKFCDKFLGMPFGVRIIPELTETVKSVMDKVEEFNKAMDEKEEVNPREISRIRRCQFFVLDG